MKTLLTFAIACLAAVCFAQDYAQPALNLDGVRTYVPARTVVGAGAIRKLTEQIELAGYVVVAREQTKEYRRVGADRYRLTAISYARPSDTVWVSVDTTDALALARFVSAHGEHARVGRAVDVLKRRLGSAFVAMQLRDLHAGDALLTEVLNHVACLLVREASIYEQDALVDMLPIAEICPDVLKAVEAFRAGNCLDRISDDFPRHQ